MKVYAVIEKCDDNYYHDYTIIDCCVYLKEEDAENRMKEILKEQPYLSEDIEIRDFEVKGLICDCLSCSNSFSDDVEDGTQILRCTEKNYEIVDDHGYCELYH